MSATRSVGGGSFDRVRPRTAQEPPPRTTPRAVDVEGKSALFSAAAPVPAFGSLTVACGGCHARSVLSPRRGIAVLFPSLHLPLVRRERSFLRCPACGRWEWCRLTVRI